MTYTVGSIATVSVIFANAVGTLVDPTSPPTLLVQAPDGTQTTPSPVHDSTGHYHYDLAVAQSGIYFYRWTGTGNGIAQTVQEGSVTVAASIFHAPSAIDLCTLDDVKALLDIPNTQNSSDLKLGRMITSMSQFFLNLVQTEGFKAPVSITEARNGNDNTRIVAKKTPIISVTAVSINGKAVSASPDGVQVGWANDRFSIYLVGGQQGCTPAPWRFWKGYQNISLQYSYGYASTPADISEAIAEAVVFKTKRMAKLGISSEALTGIGTISYDKQDVPPQFMSVVKQYKDRAIIE